MDGSMNATTLIDALNHPIGRDLVDRIEDYLASTDGAIRFADEIEMVNDELEAITGYRYTVTA